VAVVQVEFFGIPRLRAGVGAIAVEATNTRELLKRLADRFPRFAETCLSGGELKREYLLNINGRRFTRADEVELHPGDTVLILSADPGGA
jgi:molybdopterin converting factor small subunit